MRNLLRAKQSNEYSVTVISMFRSVKKHYQRLFYEYVAAKRSLGDPVDHIRLETFTKRLRESEKQMSDKHGRPFRYKIEVQGREVVLTAIPLA